MSAALDLVDGDEDLLRELAILFLKTCPKLLEDAREALERFQEGWNGEPKELSDYVEEIDRFLRTHGTNNR